MHLTLLVPELVWPEPADQFTFGHLHAPAAARLFGQGQLGRQGKRAFEHVLADLFGLSASAFAPYRLLGEGDAQARDGHWLCADPVHLRFHHERIVLADAGAFELGLDEARALADSLNQTFPDVGQFHVSDARRWYLRLNSAVAHPVEPLSAVAGRRVDGELSGPALPLTRWLNEVQMLLHTHPVNEARQRAGQPAINSLWLWGGGELAAPSAPFSSIWADDVLTRGLAAAAGTPARPLPTQPATVLAEGGKHPLLVLDSLLPRVLYEDGEGWRKACQKLDADWLAPLVAATGRRVDRLSLIAPTVYGLLKLEFTAADRWKFWRRPLPLPTLATQLAENPQ